MGTEVLRPHDCLAPRARRPRPLPLRPAAGRRRTPAARQCQGRGARGDRAVTTITVPRQPQVVRTKVAVAAAADAYAGPAFGAMSPSPRALPLPRFPARTVVADDATVVVSAGVDVDDAATRELRRLLGLH